MKIERFRAGEATGGKAVSCFAAEDWPQAIREVAKKIEEHPTTYMVDPSPDVEDRITIGKVIYYTAQPTHP